MTRVAWFLSVAFGLASIPTNAWAQDCDCDHVLPPDVTGFDGAMNGVEPGHRICVMAGDREFLRFQNLAGTPAEPITIVNCGGLVRIHNEDRAYALVFEDDSHDFHVTGTGDPEIEYGFDISAPDLEPYSGVGLWLLGRSTNYEADHLEIHHTGFAGVMAKTDPLCDGSADQDVFVQRNAELHHLFVHDTGGEGFYVGSTQSNGQTITCEGTPEVHQPHFLEGIEIHDNLVVDTGWDGMQVGMARTGCRVYRNVIRNVGLAREEYQEQGLQIGTFSACEVFANVIEEGPAMGIIVLGAGNTLIHSNLIVGFDEGDGIYANLNESPGGVHYRFLFNTIVGWDRNAITLFGPALGSSEGRSNLLIGSGPGIAASNDVDFEMSDNLVFTNAAEAGFVGTSDFHLQPSSVARGAGVASPDVTVDLDGYPRASPPAAGAFEYHDPTIDAGPGFDPGPGPGPSDGGCGCRTAAPTQRPAALAVLALALCMIASGRRLRRP